MIKTLYKTCIAAVILIVVSSISNTAFAQGAFTNMGREFLFGFSTNYKNPYIGGAYDGLHLELKIVTSRAAHVKITYNYILQSDPDNAVVEFDIPENQVYSYVFSDEQRNMVYSEADNTDLRTISIETSNSVTIYAINLIKYTTDATAILPISNWGKEYILSAVNKVGYQVSTGGYTIVAKEDGTVVNIGGQGTITLNKNQIYRKLEALSATFGNRISANKDIAVFATHSCVSWPNSTGCDHQWEQLVPASNFGKEFMVPKAGMGSEYMCIVATESGTTVRINMNGSTSQYTINTGRVYEFELTNDAHVVASKQIGITAHIGGELNANPNYCGGDPATAWVPPLEQHINRAYIAPFSTNKSAIVCHYVLLMTKTADRAKTKINGATVSSGWRNHASGYSVLTYEMPSLIPYEVVNDAGVVVLAFGVGPTESYYYLAASSARKLDASFTINGIHYQDANLGNAFSCGTSFDFSANIEYALSAGSGHLRWYIDGVEEVAARDQLSWTKPYLTDTNHTVKLVVRGADEVEEELEATIKVECDIKMTPEAFTLLEGQAQQMEITLSGSAPIDIEFDLSAYTGTTAYARDYYFPEKVTITKGSKDVKFYVAALPDNVINEPDVLLKLRAYNSEYGELFADITIKDQTAAEKKVLSISVDNKLIYEPHTGIAPSPTQATVTVSLPKGATTEAAIPITLSYAGSTATLGSDYTIAPATATSSVTIPKGKGSVSFVLNALEDNLYEEDELISITASATGYTMGTNNAVVTIKDQTPGDIIVVALHNAEESPTPRTGKFRIQFQNTDVRTKKKVEVVYKLTGTANDGKAYDLIEPAKATIPVDGYYVDVEIKPKNNYVVEGAREVTITLLSAASVEL